MRLRTKPIRQLFSLKDFKPEGEDSWATETYVGFDPIVQGTAILEDDYMIVILTEDRVASKTTVSKLKVVLSKVGVKHDDLHWAGHIVRTMKLGPCESSVELDVWTNAPVNLS